MEPFVGEIRAFAFGQIPKGWAPCNGSLMAISQNSALFSLLGVRYGGDGKATFGLPDLRGRTPIGYGQVGGVNVPLGNAAGVETVALTTDQVPSHAHAVRATSAIASTNVPNGNLLAQAPAATVPAYAAPTSATLAAAAVAPSGAGVAHENMQPSLAVSWCIATTGLYPSRN